MKKIIAASYITSVSCLRLLMKRETRTVFTKNQCFATVAASKKNVAPAPDWFKKSDARVAIQLKSEKPAPDFSTKRATACWRNNPTMTVGL
jgi:hypothetical protein